MSHKILVSRIYKRFLQLNSKKTAQSKNESKIWIDMSSKKKYLRAVCTWKKCSSLGIREVQIKITVRYYFRPARMGILNKTGNNKCWWGWELEPSYVPGRNVKWCSHFEKQAVMWKVGHKTHTNQQFHSEVFYARDMKTCPQKYLHKNIHSGVSMLSRFSPISLWPHGL